MADFSSSDSNAERPNRPRAERAPYRRPERSSSSRANSSERGERKPYQRDGERKPYERRDGERTERGGRPARFDSASGSAQRAARDGERKPYQHDGERKPFQRDGERKPYQRDGERKPYQRDGERKPYQRDGERKPYQRDGERKPYQRDGERKPYQRDGERKPYQRDGERKPYERDGERKPYERRESKPWVDRDGNPQRKRPGGPRREDDRREERPRREWDERPSHNDPSIPDSVQARDLDKGAYVELKGLSKENAERVARHLVASALAFEADPALAHLHALAAARTAGRIAVVRETVAITAYETGDFALALRELRTYRRLTGKNEHIALIVDSERGLGRADKALEEGRAVDRASIPVESRVALAIAMSGARLDLGQADLALGELEIPELDPNRAFEYSPSLFHAYAEVLDELGRAKDSALWRHRAEVAQSALDERFQGDDVIEVFEEMDDAIAEVLESGESEPVPTAAEAVGDESAGSKQAQSGSE